MVEQPLFHHRAQPHRVSHVFHGPHFLRIVGGAHRLTQPGTPLGYRFVGGVSPLNQVNPAWRQPEFPRHLTLWNPHSPHLKDLAVSLLMTAHAALPIEVKDWKLMSVTLPHPRSKRRAHPLRFGPSNLARLVEGI